MKTLSRRYINETRPPSPDSRLSDDHLLGGRFSAGTHSARPRLSPVRRSAHPVGHPPLPERDLQFALSVGRSVGIQRRVSPRHGSRAAGVCAPG